jgi:oxazoline/thiazoline dehydrogenase
MDARAQAAPVTVESPLDVGCSYRLSRHLQLRPHGQGFIIQSLISGRHESLPNAGSLRLLLGFVEPVRLGKLLASVAPPKSTVALTVFKRWFESGFITEVDDYGATAEDRIRSLEHWEPHDLAFHLRSRRGRNPAPVGATWRIAGIVPPEPVRRVEHERILERIPLRKPDIEDLHTSDPSLTEVLERRRSRYSTAAVPVDDLAELLFRACRVTGTFDMGDPAGPLIRKVHPSGGSLHSLETYVVAYRCDGLAPGGYRYDPFEHRLERLVPIGEDLRELLHDAQTATVRLKDLPSVLLIFASRFRRVTRKYESLSYHVILQEVGALYQTIYLVAEAMGLAVSALGAGNSDVFARAFKTDFFAESSVGEMILGGEG